MSALRWLLAVPLLVVMIIGVGMVMLYVYGGAPMTTAAIGASFAVIAWHALRRTGSLGVDERAADEERPVGDDWPTALAMLALFAGVFALGLWKPLLAIAAWIAFLTWARLRSRD